MTNHERAMELIKKLQSDTIEYIDRRVAALEAELAAAIEKANNARYALRRTPVEAYAENGNAIADKAHVEKWLQDKYTAEWLARDVANLHGSIYELRQLRTVMTRND